MNLSWIAELSPWHWFLIAIALIILEALSPAAFFMWLAVAAGVVGLVLSVFPAMAWQIQLVLFAGFSVLSIFLGRRYLKRHPIATDEPTLNKRGHQYLGRVFTLDQPIVNGVGKLKVDDTIWKIGGLDCPGGTKVRVSGVDGVVLLVTRAEENAGPDGT
jgi:membrane protein implicated in regulation of membrane protease activity